MLVCYRVALGLEKRLLSRREGGTRKSKYTKEMADCLAVL